MGISSESNVDVKLLFGASEGSLEQISNDIQRMLAELDTQNKFRIKIGVDLTEAETALGNIKKNFTEIINNHGKSSTNTNAVALSYNDATRAIKDYYKILLEVDRAPKNALTQTDQGWRAEIAGYEALANALNRSKIAFDLYTNSANTSKFTSKQQIALLGLQTSEAQRYAIAAEKINVKQQNVDMIKAQSAAYKEALDVINRYYEIQTRWIASNNDVVMRGGVYTSPGAIWQPLADELNRVTSEYSKLSAVMHSLPLEKQTELTRMEEKAKSDLAIVISRVAAREAEASKIRLDEASVLRSYNTALNQGLISLKNWTAAENSKNESSRVAYTTLQTATSALQDTYKQYNNHEKTLQDLKSKTDAYRLTLKNTETELRNNGDATESLTDRLTGLASKFASWLSITQVIMYGVRSIRKMIRASVELDTALTQLQVVTNASNKEMEFFADTAADAAKKVGVAITDFINSATVFARLGYNTLDSSTLAEYTTMLQNVGDIDAQSAQDAITAIIKAFDVNISNIESVMDKLVKVGNNFPISVSQIAEGLNNSASTLHAAGNTFEQSVALLTAANTTIQNAAKASTGLRTIAARLRNTKTELDDLGEAMTEAAYNDLVSALTKANVSLKDANGDLRSTYDVMADIASVWSTLTKMEQAGLATAISGTRQQAIFYSIIEQFDEASNAMDAMSHSSGALNQAYEIFMQSIQAHINQFKAAFSAFSGNTFTPDFLNTIIDVATKLMEILNGIMKIFNAVGGLNTALKVTIGYLLIIKSATIFTTLAKIPKLFLAILSPLTKVFQILTRIPTVWASFHSGTALVVTGTSRLSAALKGLGITITGTQAAMMGIIAVLGLLSLAYNKRQEYFENVRQEARNYIDKISDTNSIYEQYQAYKKAKQALDDTTASKDALREASVSLSEALGIENEIISEAEGHYQNTTIRQLNDAKEDAERAINLALGSIEQHSTRVAEISTPAGWLVPVTDVSTFEEYYDMDAISRLRTQIAAWENMRNRMSEMVSDNKASSYTYSWLLKISNWLGDDFDIAIDALKKFDELTDQIYKIENGITEDNSTSVERYIASLEGLVKTVNALKSAYDSLATAEKEMLHGGLSLETINSLSSATEDYIDYLYVENGLIKLNVQAWREMYDAKVRSQTSEIQKEIDAIQEENKQLSEQLKFYDKVDDKWAKQTIRDITKQIEENTDKIIENQNKLEIYNSLYNNITDQMNERSAAITKITNAKEGFNQLEKMYNDIADGGVFDFSQLVDSDFVNQFKYYGEVYDDFIKQISNSPNDIQACQDAFDRLINTFVNESGVLEDVSDDTRDLTVAMLEQMGVTNAAKVVDEQLEYQKAKLKYATDEYVDKTYEEIAAEYDLVGAGSAAQRALAELAIEKFKLNDDAHKIDSAEDVQALLDIANAAKMSIVEITRLQNALRLYQEADRLEKEAKTSSFLHLGFDDTADALKKHNQLKLAEQLRENADRIANEPITFTPISYNDIKVAYKPHVNNNDSNKSGDKEIQQIEEYIAELDPYYKLLKQLEDIENKIKEKQSELESAETGWDKINITSLIESELFYEDSDDNGNKITKRVKGLIGLYEAQKDVLERLNKARQTAIEENKNELVNRGFEVEYDTISNNFFIKNLEHLNDLKAESADGYESLEEATNAYRKETEALIRDTEELNSANQEGSESIRNLTQNIKDDGVKVINYLKENVSLANDALDVYRNIYDTLQSAANEYAANGFITIETLQSLIGLGTQYMQYLTDENGALVINRERIEAVLSAKTQELALEEALTYVERVRLAIQEDSVESLDELLYTTTDATNATWDLVYAKLAELNLNQEQYEAALHNINAIRSLAKGAASGIGKVAGKLSDELSDMKSGLDNILNYVMDMLKQRINDQIDALQDMKDAFGDVIELRKKSLDESKKEADYQKSIAKRTQEIAKLQSKINSLSLDDSREAKAQRAKLQEELANLQEELTDEQFDHAKEAQESALDDMQKAYEAEKDSEIKALEESVSSTEKLYRIAIDYIRDNWEDLKNQLIQWNYDIGNNFESDIVSAWENALKAAQKYGSYVTAINHIDADISSAEGSTPNDIVSGSRFVGRDEFIHSRIKEMWQNSQAWHKATQSRQAALEKRNDELGEELRTVGVNAIKDEGSGAWYVDYIGGDLLYDKYKDYIYHSGGIVGNNPTLKQNEVMALLQKGEVVLDKKREQGLYKIIDFVQLFSDKMSKALTPENIGNRLLSGYAFDHLAHGLLAPAGNGIEFSPTVNVTISHNGSMTEEDARRYGKIAADSTLSELTDAFSKRGITNLGNAFLK